MLTNWISPHYLNPKTQHALKTKFKKAKPFPYLELKNFFNPQKVKQIEQALKKELFEFKAADLFQFSQTKDLVSAKSKILQEFRSFLISKEFISFMETITHSKLKKNSIDMAGTLYNDTDFLLCHDDQLERRQIAYFFYLSTMKKDDGGKLQLYASKQNKPNKIQTTIAPNFNTFAFFQVSPKSFHSVEEVTSTSQRIAISGWFHHD